MKLSTKIILPIILISALLILLNGCMGTVPDDESPGYTPGTITGIIAAPCCENSVEPADGETGSPEYWCNYCVKTWYLQNGVEVILTYGEEEISTTTTNDKGEYTFTNVDPGKNYVVTAYCPDYDDDRPLVKDVALELVEGGYFDTKITDIVSTSLGLVVDFLVDFTILGPEDIVLDDVIADKPDFKKFPKFRKLITEVVRVLEVCQDVNADDDLQYALCRAAEEISKLTIGCGPGYTPPLVVRHTVTYNGNTNTGGTAPVDASSPYVQGATVTVLGQGSLVKANYTFTGWNTAANGGGTSRAPASTFSMPASNVTLYAQWTEDTKYTVTYDGNGNTGGTAPVDASSPYYVGETVTVKDKGSLVKANYHFTGWKDGHGTDFAAGASFSMPAENVTLYAQWEEDTKYTVTYDGNGNTGGTAPVDASSPYYVGETVTVKDKGSLVKANYHFTGWKDGHGTDFAAGASFSMPAENVTLYAQWEEDTKYTVTYDANGGTGSQSDGSSPYYAGATVTVLDENDMELAGGYTFDGWNTAADGSGDDYVEDDTFNMPADDVTLYAQWICDPCSGWEATGVTVYLYYYPGSPGKSDPRIDVDGAITGPTCAQVTEIEIDFLLYNHGGTIKESYSETVSSPDNTFTVDLDIDPASYNAGDNYKLWITVPGCSEMMIIEGPIVQL